MKILIAGDTHGDKFDFQKLFMVASKNYCEKIIVAGDFGFFPNLDFCNEFLEYVSSESLKRNIPVAFVDGNHENHEVLKKLFEEKDSETILVKPGIEWLFRGKFSDNILSMGGAYSIDKHSRTPGIDWFDGEMICMKD